MDAFLAALRTPEAGVYVNFVADEGPARVREAYPAGRGSGWRPSRRRYDPDNLFRLNQNITPAKTLTGAQYGDRSSAKSSST